MNIKTRLIPRRHRSAYQAVRKATADIAAANRRLAAATTPRARATAEEAVMRASNRHHQAMGRLPLWLQAFAKKG